MVLALHQSHDYAHVKELGEGSNIRDYFARDLATENYVVVCGEACRERSAFFFPCALSFLFLLVLLQH